MFELGEHRLFSVNRRALTDQQTLGQVLLIKSFKHIFPCRQTTMGNRSQQSAPGDTVVSNTF